MTGLTIQVKYAMSCAVLVCLGSLALAPSRPSASTRSSDSRQESALRSDGYLRNAAPLFELNQGQSDPRVDFLARGRGHSFFLTRDGAVWSLGRPGSQTSDVVRISLLGSHSRFTAEGLDQVAGSSHYLVGNDPARWRANIPSYRKVRYHGVYPGVDLVYFGRGSEVEYDFIVAAGADPAIIRLKFEAARGLRIDSRGDLLIETTGGVLRQGKPLVYQDTPEGRTGIPGGYTLLASNQVGFEIPRYDVTRTLVIDPVLSYSTYLGGGGDDIGNAIAVDSSGHAYVTGLTGSSNFPITEDVFQPEHEDDDDVFVTKLDPTGGDLIFSTFLGGGSDDIGNSIAIDDSGNVYVTGLTESSDFPVSDGAIQGQFGGGDEDCFVTKLSPDGRSAVYSTFLGAGGRDQCTGIAVDAMENAYVTGVTRSQQFPVTPGAFQTAFGGGDEDAFVTKYDAAGDTVVYSTFLGAGGNDGANAIAVDSAGRSHVTGYTQSNQFPVTADALQRQRDGERDAFLVKLSANGRQLLYGTFHGGGDNDEGRAIALDGDENIHIAGITESTDLPVSVRAFQRAFDGGDTDAFVAKFDSTGAVGIYSTYLGGEGGDAANAIAVDFFGNAAVVGVTRSPFRFPTNPGALQPDFGGGQIDGFVAKLGPAGQQLIESTFLGGNDDDEAKGVAVDSPGNIYVTGFTLANNFPITDGAFQDTRDSSEVFVARIGVVRFTTVPAASFAETAAAPNSIVSGFGGGFATTEVPAPPGQPLPPELAGVRVVLTDSEGFPFTAPLFVVAPLQINYLVPGGIALGPAIAVVTLDGAEVAKGTLEIAAVAPGLFSANADGQGVAAAFVTRRNAGGDSTEFVFNNAAIGSRVAAPIDLGPPTDQVFLSLFGSGIRGGNEVTVVIGGTPAEVLFAGAQVQFQGLDQVNVLLPRSLIGRGQASVILTVDGQTANVVTISVS